MTFEMVSQIAAGSIADLIIESLFDRTKNAIMKKADNAKIKLQISEYSEKYFKEKYELLNIQEQFDFSTLNEWLSGKIKKIIAIESEPINVRNHYEMQLTKEACAFSARTLSSNTPTRKLQVSIYMRGIYNTIRGLLVEDIATSEKVSISLIVDEIEEFIKDEMHVLSKELIAMLNYKNSFEEWIDCIENRKLPSSGFNYTNNAIGFYGREKESLALDRFLDCETPVLLWAVTGPGGVGKSKFVYEYTRRKVEDPNWRVCYLNKDQVEVLLKFNSWEYPFDLLLIVDYAGSCIEALSRWLQILQLKRRKKLRLLMLERQGYIVNNFKETIEPDWYFRLHSGVSSFSSTGAQIQAMKFLDSEYPGFIQLGGLSDDALFLMMEDYAQKIRHRKLTTQEKKSIVQYVRKNEKNSIEKAAARPLFILFTLDAFLDGKEYNHWDREKLINYVLDQSKKYWLESLCHHNRILFKATIWLLVYSTSTVPWTRGVSLDVPFHDAAAEINMLSETEATRLFCGVLDNEAMCDRLPSLEPDILGELLVLNFYKDEIIGKEAEQSFLWQLWRNKFTDLTLPPFGFFLSRCIDDFGYIPQIGNMILRILQQLIQKALEPKTIERIPILLVKLISTHIEENMMKAQEQLHDLFIRWPQCEEFAAGYAEGLLYTYNAGSVEYDKEKRDKWSELMARWPKSEKIGSIYADSLLTLGLKQNADDALKTIDQLGELSIRWSKNEEICLSYAKGMNNLIASQKAVDAKKTLNQLLKLRTLWPMNEKFDVIYAKGLTNVLNKQKLKNAQETLDTIYDLTKQWPRNEQISWLYAYGLYMICFVQNANDAYETFLKLCELKTQWPHSGNIAEAYAFGLAGLSRNQNAEEIQKTIHQINKLATQWPDEEGIAEALDITLEYLNDGQLVKK